MDNPSGTGMSKTNRPVRLYCTKKATRRAPKRLQALLISEGMPANDTTVTQKESMAEKKSQNCKTSLLTYKDKQVICKAEGKVPLKAS